MKYIATILVWIALAAYSFHHVRHLTRRMDDALGKEDDSGRTLYIAV